MRKWLPRILAVAALILIAWVLLHLIPTSESVEKADAATKRGTPIARAYHLFRQGHPRAARRVLRRANGKRWNRVRVYQTYGNDRFFRRNGRCRWDGFIVSVKAVGIGVELYNARFSQRFCWNGRRVYRVRPLRASGDVRDFGEFLNWEDEGVTDAATKWCRNRVCKASAKVITFHQCTPIAIGCIFPRDDGVMGVLTVIRDGSTKVGT